MQIWNQFIVFLKRIFSHRLYIVMLAISPVLTLIYCLLPQQSRSADIKAALYAEVHNAYTDTLFSELINGSSLYDFYIAADEDTLLRDVKSGYAECGYIIPADFFENYINGSSEYAQITQYVIPSATLSATINETVFSCIFELCANDILLLGAELHDYDAELTERLNGYMNSDTIFRIEDSVQGEFSFDTLIYNVKLPVYDLCTVFILFACLLGLLLYQQDSEKNMYVSMSALSRAGVKCICILTDVLPMLLVGLICITIMQCGITQMLHLTLYAMICYVGTLCLGLIIKKSTLLLKVLPLIMLTAIIISFLSTLL